MKLEIEETSRKRVIQMNPDVIEKLRIKKKMSCADLCKEMGRTAGWYSRIRTGEVPLKAKYIPQLAEVLGVKPEKLARDYFSGFKLEDTSTFNETA